MRNNPFFQVLAVADFRKIWGSQILTQLTLNLINFVIILKIFAATGSTVAISLVWIFYIIPVILLGPFSGVVVDLLERRRVLFFTNLIQAVIILFYLLIKTKIWPIYGVVFLYSLVYQLYIPAEASTIPRVVPKSLLPPANSFFLFTIYGAMIGGFSLAGPLVKRVGQEIPFILGSFFLLAAALVVSLLPQFIFKKKKKVDGPQKFFNQAKEGYLFIRRQPTILLPLLVLAFAQILVTPLILLAPSYATEILKLDLLDVGPALVLPFGLGALAGVLMVVWALRRMRKKKVINFAFLCAAFWLFILSLVIPSLARLQLPAAVLAVFFLGLSYVSFIIPSQTLIQEKTPEEFRGRVFGVLGFLVNLALVFPILLTATVADILGTTWTIFIVALLISLVWFYSRKELYEYGHILGQ